MPRGIVLVCLGTISLLAGIVLLSACAANASSVATPTGSLQQATVVAKTPTPAVLVGTVSAVGTVALVPPVVPTGTPILSQSPTPFPAVAGTDRTITLADNGKTIRIEFAHRFLLALDPSLDWTVTIANPDVVKRLENTPVPRGAQGVYHANLPEQTKLAAVGDAPCRKSQPPCAVPSRTFEVEIVVEYSK